MQFSYAKSCRPAAILKHRRATKECRLILELFDPTSPLMLHRFFLDDDEENRDHWIKIQVEVV
jgi:hypothetical protein